MRMGCVYIQRQKKCNDPGSLNIEKFCLNNAGRMTQSREPDQTLAVKLEGSSCCLI